MISNDYASKILNTLLTITGTGVEQIAPPKAVYLGLCNAKPNDDGSLPSGSEPDGKMTSDNTKYYYKRKFVSGVINEGKENEEKVQLFSAAQGGIISNSSEIQMVTAREAYPATMNYWFLSTSSTIGEKAFLWGEIYTKDPDTGDYIVDLEGNKVVGITIDKNTVPTFYEGELQASIDVNLGTTTEA